MEKDNYQCEICLASDYKVRECFTKRLFKDTDSKFQVVKCQKCGLHSLFPIPSTTDLKWIYSNYSVQGDRLTVEKFRIKNVYPEKIAKIKKYHTNPTILDIGAGIGGFCYVAKSKGIDVFGIEMEKEQVEKAKMEFGIDLYNTTIENFLNKNIKTFDCLHLHHVLEHLRHPKNILISLRKILTPDGIIVLEVPNQFFVFKNELKIKFNMRKPETTYNPYHHIYFFSPNTLRYLINASGYELLELNESVNNQNTIRRKTHKLLAQICKMGSSVRIEAIIRKIERN